MQKFSLPKVIRVCIGLFYFALWMVKKIRPLSRSIRCETETNNGHDLVARVFSLFWEFGFFLTLSLFSLALKGSFLSSDWLFWLLQTSSLPPPPGLFACGSRSFSNTTSLFQKWLRNRLPPYEWLKIYFVEEFQLNKTNWLWFPRNWKEVDIYNYITD